MTKDNIKQNVKVFLYDMFIFPLYILTHPIKGFEDFKFEKKGKMHIAIIYFILMILTLTLVATKTGFIIKPIKDLDFSIIETTLIVSVPILLGVVGNWAVTSLMDGKGKMSDIFKVLTYGLAPYIWFAIPLTFLSNYLTLDEMSLYTTLMGIGIVFSVYMIFMGLLVNHEYGLAKTIITTIFTVIAIAIIIFIILLFLTLIQNFFGFAESFYRELLLRFR